MKCNAFRPFPNGPVGHNTNLIITQLLSFFEFLNRLRHLDVLDGDNGHISAPARRLETQYFPKHMNYYYYYYYLDRLKMSLKFYERI